MRIDANSAVKPDRQSRLFFDRWSRGTRALGARVGTLEIMFHARSICRLRVLSKSSNFFENLNDADIISIPMYAAC